MTKFTNTIESFDGQTVKAESFKTREEAKKGARAMKKEFQLTSHAGHVVNYSKRIELFTNY